MAATATPETTDAPAQDSSAAPAKPAAPAGVRGQAGRLHAGETVRIKRGLDLPIKGAPDLDAGIVDAPRATRVAILGDDYVGMKPTMLVAEGDEVTLGQPLFEDKKTEGVHYVAPASGTVTAVNRGAKRKFLSVEIAVADDAAAGEKTFDIPSTDFGSLGREQVEKVLLESGEWSALRTRPFSRVPTPGTSPTSLFITAIDTEPLAVDPTMVIEQHSDAFTVGVQVLSRLTDGPTYVCIAPPDKRRHEFSQALLRVDGVYKVAFDGPHPAGLPGTHIHFLDPVARGKEAWHVHYQDVIAIGKLFQTGRLFTERVVSLAGPVIEDPRVVRTVRGANLNDLAEGQLTEEAAGQPGMTRLVSGSVLSGRTAIPPIDYLGRYHLQVSALKEGRERELLGWQKPGFDKHSVLGLVVGHFLNKVKGAKFDLDTSTNGSRRAMVPVGSYEKVLPLDLVPTYLLRSLIVNDIERAQELGCLELAEEDLALCTYVCPGKYSYGPILRRNLDIIWKEG